MAIGEYLRIFRRFWWVVLLTMAIGAGVGYLTTLFSTPLYVSTARLFVTTQSGVSVGDAYQNNLFSQERVFSYAGLATSEQVAARAIDQLKAPITTDELRAKVTALPLEKTVLLDVSVTDTDPAAAQRYANAVADQLVVVTRELETSRRGGESSAGAVLVDDAGYGAKVSGMSLTTRIGLGVAGGLLVGVILAVLLGLSDTRLRRRESVGEASGEVLLGALVSESDRFEGEGGVIDLDAGGVAVERIREVRTNLQFARTAAGSHPRVIAVTSPSAQDGRSTTAADLAAAFAETGHSVVVVDGDLVNPTLNEVLGLGEDEMARVARSGLGTVLAGQHDVSEALIELARKPQIALLPAGPLPSVRRQLWAEASAERVIETLRKHFDYVIIDTPPLTDYSDGTVPAALGDGAIVLARIGHTKSTALRKALKVLETAHAEVIGVVATCESAPRGRRVPREQARSGTEFDDAPSAESAEEQPVEPGQHAHVVVHGSAKSEQSSPASRRR